MDKPKSSKYKKVISNFIFWIIFLSSIIGIGYFIHTHTNHIYKLFKQQESSKVKKPIIKKKSKVKAVNKKIKFNGIATINVSNMQKEQKKQFVKNLATWIYSNYKHVYKHLSVELATDISNTRFPLLMVGLIGAESSFKTQLSSYANAYGLCQIIYNVWKKDSPKILSNLKITSYQELYDPKKNIALAEYILLKYIQESGGNIKNALVRYQTGKHDLKKLNSKQRIRTRKYVSKVLEICGSAYVSIMLSHNKSIE